MRGRQKLFNLSDHSKISEHSSTTFLFIAGQNEN